MQNNCYNNKTKKFELSNRFFKMARAPSWKTDEFVILISLLWVFSGELIHLATMCGGLFCRPDKLFFSPGVMKRIIAKTECAICADWLLQRDACQVCYQFKAVSDAKFLHQPASVYFHGAGRDFQSSGYLF